MKHLLFFIFTFLCFFEKSAEGRHAQILVLPSGGATAIMPVVLLEHIEHELQCSIDQIFDEIWCSSAGSITASLLAAPSSKHKKAEHIVEFFKHNFSNYYKAYRICKTLEQELGSHVPLSRTSVIVRILAAAAQDSNFKTWKLYDFSSDGSGSCNNKKISLLSCVRASCTVYPYPYAYPEKITISKENSVLCVDAASLCMNHLNRTDPTAYFLEQMLERLDITDTATIYFLGNAFTPTIDYGLVEEVLKKSSKKFTYAINNKNQSCDFEKKQIEIITIPASSSSEILEKYLQNCSFAKKCFIKIVIKAVSKFMGKENAVPNIVGAGTVESDYLIKEAKEVIRDSKNFRTMLGMLKKFKTEKLPS